MEASEEKENRPSPKEHAPEYPQKLPEAWQLFLEAIRRHYGSSSNE